MPITNKLGLPEPIVKALMHESYNPGSGDFSCTELISPPKLAALKKKHKENIFEDASDMLYSMYGTAVHYILERGGTNLAGHKAEVRYYAKFGKWNVSAQIDCLSLADGILSDYKFTSTYAFNKNADGSFEVKKEWFCQLNIQAEILKRNNIADIKKLQIVGLLRNWEPTKAASDERYPQTQIVIMEIPMVSSERTEKYILERCELHQAARDCQIDDEIPECTKEERWEDDTKYALMKAGNKKASKVCESKAAAEDWLSSQEDAGKFSVELRNGFPRRCMKYCQASKFCHHYKSIVENRQVWAV